MILDKLENADWYYDSVPGLKEFMKFYNDNDLEEMPACKIFLGWKAQVDCQEVTQEYDEGKDVEFYGDKATAKFTVPAGHFAVFFPSDAHQPGIAPGKEYRKLIVKARVNN